MEEQKQDDNELGMLDSSAKFDSVVDRYYTKYYLPITEKSLSEFVGSKDPDAGDATLDQFYFEHTNKLTLVGLSEKHTAIQNHRNGTDPIVEVNFGNKTEKEISGKGKRGAAPLEFMSMICTVHAQSGQVYKIRSFLKNAKLIEMND